MSPLTLVLVLVFGNLLLVGGILYAVFSAMARAVARERAAIEHEGVVLDSGRVRITTRYRNFSSPRLRAGGVSLNVGYLVLTRERLVVVKAHPRYGSFTRAELGRFTVGIGEDGRLRLHSDDPPGATGSVEYQLPVSDPSAWVKALTDAGARSAA